MEVTLEVKPQIFIDVRIKNKTHRLNIESFEDYAKEVADFCQAKSLPKETEKYLKN